MAFISELHYSNAYANTSGVSEFLEVGLLPGEDPANFQVAFYHSDGFVGEVVTLNNATIPSSVGADGNTYYVIGQPQFNIYLTDPNGNQNNNYEAFALLDTTGPSVISFWDIGGGTQNITPQDGPAFGLGVSSSNIAVPTGPGSATYSVQFSASDPNTPLFVPVTPGSVVCFCDQTQIATPSGLRRIADLELGDLVETVDTGALPLRWLARRRLSRASLRAQPGLRPVVISAGALGPGSPWADLRVSRQHRIAVRGAIARRMFGAHEVLVPAKDLLALPGVWIDESATPLTYVHLVLDSHEMLITHGVQAESLLPGAMARQTLGAEAVAELDALFGGDWATQAGQASRPLVSGRRARALVARHIKNARPLV